MFLRKPERPSDYLIYFFMIYGVIAIGTLVIEFFIFEETSFKHQFHGLSIAATCTFIEWISNAVRKENGRRESEMKEKDAEL